MKRASALKRLLSLVLCLCMVLSLLPTIAPVEAEAAEEPSYISGIYFASDSNKTVFTRSPTWRSWSGSGSM